jgi:hypothetical protein
MYNLEEVSCGSAEHMEDNYLLQPEYQSCE